MALNQKENINNVNYIIENVLDDIYYLIALS